MDCLKSFVLLSESLFEFQRYLQKVYHSLDNHYLIKDELIPLDETCVNLLRKKVF